MLDSGDGCLISAYKSWNAKFKKFPSSLRITLPTFVPHQIDREQINQQFGSLADTPISEDLVRKDISISTSVRSFIDTPRAILPQNLEFPIDCGIYHV